MNNFEYIKTMTIEEMEDALNTNFFEICRNRKCEETCPECYKKWLREDSSAKTKEREKANADKK